MALPGPQQGMKMRCYTWGRPSLLWHAAPSPPSACSLPYRTATVRERSRTDGRYFQERHRRQYRHSRSTGATRAGARRPHRGGIFLERGSRGSGASYRNAPFPGVAAELSEWRGMVGARGFEPPALLVPNHQPNVISNTQRQRSSIAHGCDRLEPQRLLDHQAARKSRNFAATVVSWDCGKVPRWRAIIEA